jgi:RsiW-degrading membrane proteinase PrsW (M82 family)
LTKAPWEYLFDAFNSRNFPDLFWPVTIASIVLLAAYVILYNIRTRQLHRHKDFLDLYEWLLWTVVITFSLLIIEAVFVFSFIFVLATILIGLATLAWVRFIRFPPILRAYEVRLAKARYVSRQRYAHPETTIRTKGARRRRRR